MSELMADGDEAKLLSCWNELKRVESERDEARAQLAEALTHWSRYAEDEEWSYIHRYMKALNQSPAFEAAAKGEQR